MDRRALVAQTIGTQAERARIPHADGTLVKTPGEPPPELIPALLAASDVLGTGWYAADAGPGKIDLGRVFDLTLPLEEAPEGYKATYERRATKVLLTL